MTDCRLSELDTRRGSKRRTSRRLRLVNNTSCWALVRNPGCQMLLFFKIERVAARECATLEVGWWHNAGADDSVELDREA